MRAYLKIICFCVLITLAAQQENVAKPRHTRDVNPKDVKPQDIVERFSREIKNIGSKANRVESIQVNDLDNLCRFCLPLCLNAHLASFVWFVSDRATLHEM